MAAELFRTAGISNTNSELPPGTIWFRDVVLEEGQLIAHQKEFRKQYARKMPRIAQHFGMAEDASAAVGGAGAQAQAAGAAGSPPEHKAERQASEGPEAQAADGVNDGSADGKEGGQATDSLCGSAAPDWLQADSWFEAAKSYKPGTVKGRAGTPTPFSLAFSGGGVRAAAFQSGVLWRLAQEGLLKDVDYLAAVSGGAYIASSYASHLRSTHPPQPDQGEDLDEWYCGVVARTICRMQRNAGDFVRDPGVDRKWWKPPEDGAGCLPRIFDLPQLLMVLAISLVSKPLLTFCVLIVPAVEVTFHFFGAALRSAFCARGTMTWEILLNSSPWLEFLLVAEVLIVVNFVLRFIKRVPPFNKPIYVPPDQGKPVSHHLYLYLNGLTCFMSRALGVLLGVMLVVLIITSVEVANWDQDEHSLEWRQALCEAYSNSFDGKHRCEDTVHSADGSPWWQGAYDNDPNINVTRAEEQVQFSPLTWEGTVVNSIAVWVQNSELTLAENAMILGCGTVAISFLILPWRSDLFMSAFTLVAPLLHIVLVCVVLQRRTVSPILNMSNKEGKSAAELNEEYDDLARGFYWTGFVFFFFYDQCHKFWHIYYRRSLRKSFFAGGQDMIMKSLAECLLCPVLILTGTAVDYKPLASDDHIAEISFSQLHTGSVATGYIRTPHYRTLGKATALSGAGCLDAITLSMTHRLRFRVWLEMLNLCWGDYILFPHRAYERQIQRIARKAGERYEEAASWILYQAPSSVLYIVMFALFNHAWTRSVDYECEEAKKYFQATLMVIAFMCMLSFFSFSPYLFFMSLSPMVRHLHQLTKYYYRDYPAPGMLYVTDGGVQDCTGIIQLMLRRRRRILLVLAAADPNDELGVLRTAMAFAVKRDVASFYDPDNHRRDVNLKLDEFGQDKSQAYLRLGIFYGVGTTTTEQLGAAIRSDPNACVDSDDQDGELLIVKNRSPPSWSDSVVQPLLSESEIASTLPSGPNVARGSDDGMRYVELGGLGCCDGCHRCGCNFFAKFPHLTGANYLWLTPTLFGGLSRLGHFLAGSAIPELLKPYPESAPHARGADQAPAAAAPAAAAPPGIIGKKTADFLL